MAVISPYMRYLESQNDWLCRADTAMNPYLRVLFASVALLLTSCVSMTPKEVAPPAEISFEDAMSQLGSGFKKMIEAQGDVRTGLVASEATVTFNVKASAKDSSKLTAELSLAPTTPFPETARVGGEVGGSSEGERGNTVTVKFVNLLSLSNAAAADNLQKIIDAFKNNDWTIFKKDGERLDIKDLSDLKDAKE